MNPDFKPNEAQTEAVCFGIEKPLKVVAGAGTGKTAVLTHRFIHLVERYRIPPHRILALTFTKKAAAEMQSRIARELVSEKLIRRAEIPLVLWIGNFHSICMRLLRQNALAIGLDPSFELVDETEQRLILAEVVNDFLNHRLNTNIDPAMFDDLMIHHAGKFTDNMLIVMNRLKDHFIEGGDFTSLLHDIVSRQYRTIEHVLTKTIENDELPAGARKKARSRLQVLKDSETFECLTVDAVCAILRAYQERLESKNLLDFSDLIGFTYRLARNEPSLKERFEYVLVDEFQDTDHGQFQLLRELSDDFRNVTVVCDKKQSIYEWREARPENIDNFPGETIHLHENYRSYGEILECANHFIRRSMPGEHPISPARNGVLGFAGSPAVKLFRADGREGEAAFVASEIARLLKAGEYRPGDIAILMRSVHASRRYEDALLAAGIDYVTVGGCGFYELSEARDVLALVRLVSNPFDDLAMVRVLQSAIVGLSDASLRDVCSRRAETRSGIFDVLTSEEDFPDLPPATCERLKKLLDVITELSTTRWSHTVGEVISEALNRTEYLKYLSSLEGPRGKRFSNVARIYKAATAFEERRPGADLEDFLSYVDVEIDAGIEKGAGGSQPDTVQIMTVHQAKGLEFPVVFVVNLTVGSFPLRFRPDDYGYDETFGLFLRKIPESRPTLRYEGGYGIHIEESLKRKEYNEEERVMYVAMTRAEKLLYLTTGEQEGRTSEDADFFARIAAFASSDGNRFAEVLCSAPSVRASPKVVEPTVTEIGLETIREMLNHAVGRIRMAPPPEAPPMEVPETLSMSYSRLALFRCCPMKYALRYVYNLPLPPKEEMQDERHPRDAPHAALLGDIVHKTLMQFHRGKKADSSPNVFAVFEHLARALGLSAKFVRTGQFMLEKYLESPLARIDTVAEEQEFHWRLEDGALRIMFTGKIDRIHREGTAFKVLDYKTGLRDDSNHRLQLAIYRLAMESILGETDIATSNYYLPTGEEVEHRFSQAELARVQSEIIEASKKVISGDFGGRAGAGDCIDCSYKEFCPRAE